MQGKRRVCGNCGRTQGPFDLYWVGPRKTGQWIVTCITYKNLTPEKQAEQSKECTARREALYAATL
jgi:hypothetical protein